MEEREKRGVAVGSLGWRVSTARRGRGGLAFPALRWVPTGKSSFPHLWNTAISARIIGWAPTSLHSSLRRWVPRLSWERCSATQLGSTGWRVRRAKRRRFSSAGIPAGRGERGEWGVLAGLQGLASGLDDSGRKKKKEIEPDDSERTVRFIRFAGWTFGLADPILGRPLFRSNWPDWTGIVAGRRSAWPVRSGF